ncbi:hypothetical protein DXN04_06420 [Chitinophaga silvisoli]|uniref:DUF6794 domain-containing protein n=1 Tax=Chitinophaga silvisoli TaxID=2291814 RepID=A0A3E1P4D1_9BACT|nr:hypothetical protein DXN04_06420 [Chitinophaga silvisoli]
MSAVKFKRPFKSEMTIPKLTFFLTCLFLLTACKVQIKLPKNLDESILYFQQQLTPAELDSFKNKPESDAVIELHQSTGQWIRNNWVYGDRDTALKNYFKALGIYAPDDISSIILTSLHRTLNKKEIELEKQVETYKAYWQPIIDCREKQKIQAVSTYKKFKVGDNITLYMPVDTSEGNRNAILYNCPTTEWVFNEKKDLILKGIVTKKYFINDTANAFFTVRVTYLNRKDTRILMEQVQIGNEKNFSLTGLKIE